MSWKRYLFDFDSKYNDQNIIFVFDGTKRQFLSTDFFAKAANIVNDEYLRYIKKIDINAFFTDWLENKKKGME